MNEKPLPDFKCMCCSNEYDLMPLYVLPCDICKARACSFQCLKLHRKDCFPAMTDYPKKYRNPIMKLW